MMIPRPLWHLAIVLTGMAAGVVALGFVWSMVTGGDFKTCVLKSALTCAAIHVGIIVFGIPMINSNFPTLGDKFSAIVLDFACRDADRAFANVRHELFKSLKGDVLDVGCCTGFYLRYAMDKPDITSYTMLEPNKEMHSEIHKTIAQHKPWFPVPVTANYLEDMDAKYDSIIFGQVLCSIPDYKQAIIEAKKRLKPNGRLYFSEHVRDEAHPWKAVCQDMLHPW